MSEKAAAQRWSILANAIKSKHSRSVEGGGSKRSFQSYNILKVSPLEEEEINDDCRWRLVSYKGASLAVRYLSPRLELSQLVGFNNTGNVCVWPSEESLAVYCLNNKHLFQVRFTLRLPPIQLRGVSGCEGAGGWWRDDLPGRLSPGSL